MWNKSLVILAPMHVVSHRVSEAVEKQAVSHSRVLTKHLKLFCPEAWCFFWGIDQDSIEMASMKKPDKSSECVGKNTFPGMVRNICPGAWIACTVIHGFVMGTPRGLQFPCLVVSPHDWRSARWLRTWQRTCSGKQLSRDTLPLSATRFSSCPLDTWPISKALIWCSKSWESYWLLCEAVSLLRVAVLHAWSGRVTQMTQQSQWLGSVYWSSLVHEEKVMKPLPCQRWHLHLCVTSPQWDLCSYSYASHLKNTLLFFCPYKKRRSLLLFMLMGSMQTKIGIGPN